METYLQQYPNVNYFDGTAVLPRQNQIYQFPAPAHFGNELEILKAIRMSDLVFLGNRMIYYIGSVQQADGGPYTLTWTLESCIDESDERPDGPDSLHPTVTVELRQDQGGGKHELIAYVYYWPVSDTWYARGPSGDEQPVAPKERQTVYERQSSNTDQAGALAVVDTMANLVLTAKGKATN